MFKVKLMATKMMVPFVTTVISKNITDFRVTALRLSL